MHSQQFTNSGQQPTTLTRSFLNKQNGYKSYMMEAKDFLVSQSTFSNVPRYALPERALGNHSSNINNISKILRMHHMNL